MNFKREENSYKSLRIGRISKALELEFVVLRIMNNGAIIKEKIQGDDLHNFLYMLSGKKIPWPIILKVFPRYKNEIENGVIKISIIFMIKKANLKKFGPRDTKFLWQIKGQELFYEGKFYTIPPTDKKLLSS